jgi:leader peptidase (prepilin peptidase) / N-methyltransferase
MATLAALLAYGRILPPKRWIIDADSQSPAAMSLSITAAMTILAAPFVGCFGASAVQRHLEGKSFFFVRSCCDACARQLAFRDLVPILSWLSRGGRCRHCSAPIARLYPAVEVGFLLTALWSVDAYTYADHALLPTLVLGWTLVVLIAFDVIAFILPDPITLSLGAGGLLLALREGLDSLQQSVLGFAVGGLSLTLVSFLYRYLRGREGLGFGDVKLFAAAGAWVRLDGLPSVLFIGSLLGLVCAALTRRHASADGARQLVPLGAGLCAGVWLTWIYGPVFDWPLDSLFRFGAG